MWLPADSPKDMSRNASEVPKDEADEKGYWLVPFSVAVWQLNAQVTMRDVYVPSLLPKKLCVTRGGGPGPTSLWLRAQGLPGLAAS